MALSWHTAPSALPQCQRASGPMVPATAPVACQRCCHSSTRHTILKGSHAGSQRRAITARTAAPASTPASKEEDLLQYPDRLKWYEAKFCADDMPDWNVARFVRLRDVAPGLRAVTMEVEISRERIPLRAAYKAPGQQAAVRVFGGVERHLAVSSPPFSQELNKHPLFLVRGDLFAYEIKTAREPVSIMAELEVLVGQREAPEVYGLSEGDPLEVGPFQGAGLDLRTSGIMAIYRFPTVILFVSGKGIATAKALLAARPDVPSLNAPMRREVRMYYKVPNEASLVFKEQFEEWTAAASHPSGCKLQVVPTTQPSFQRAFDDDDELMYDPHYTAALILTGGDEEAEAEARAVCKDAEITTILSDTQEAQPLQHLDSTPTAFRRWAASHGNNS